MIRANVLNDELERGSKYTVVAYFKVLLRHLSRRNTENHRTQPVSCLEIRNPDPSNTMERREPLRCNIRRSFGCYPTPRFSSFNSVVSVLPISRFVFGWHAYHQTTTAYRVTRQNAHICLCSVCFDLGDITKPNNTGK